MMSQHEEMVRDTAALLNLVQEELTTASMMAMEVLAERLAWNLEFAAGAAQALGQATNVSG